MIVNRNGILVYERQEEHPEPPPRKMEYRVCHCSDLGVVRRMLDEIEKAKGELVSISRHGQGGRAICSSGNGYVIAYFCDVVCETWEYT